VHLALSHVTPLPLVPFLSAALLVLLGTALVLRSRGSNSGSGRSRHSGRPRVAPRRAAAPDPRFAAGARFAPSQGARFGADPRFAAAQPFAAARPFAATQSIPAAQPFVAAQSIVAAKPFVAAPHFAAAQTIAPARPFAAAPRLAPDQGDISVAQPDLRLVSVPDPGDLCVAQPDLRLVSTPDLRVVVTAPSPSVPPAASFSVLPALTENDKWRPDFALSNSGDAFPTRARAFLLLAGHLLAVAGISLLSLATTPIGHHMSNVGHTSVGSLAGLCVLVGFVFAVVVAARVQHDIMGGGWYGGFAPRFSSYISPQVALYVISVSGISDAALRLKSSPTRVIFVEYWLLVASVLLVLSPLVRP